MKAILCHRYGGPDDLVLEEVPDPIAGPGEAVVRIKAAALNFFDTLIIAGKYQHQPAFPFSPAAEFAGVVEAIGPGVERLRPGDRVFGQIGAGAARERVAIEAERLVAMPNGLDFDRAAGLTVVYGTTLHALRDRAQLKSGETLVVLGAAGGTGLAAIELGVLLGARVIAGASSAEKLAFARQHGAHRTINYAEVDLTEALARETAPTGADVIYDPVGGPYAAAALEAIAWQGRFLVIGFAAGQIPKLPLDLVLRKGCQVVGVFWGAWVARHAVRHRAHMADIAGWCAEGRLSAHVHATYPLAATPEAIKQLADRKVMGKVLIKP
ncbi:MAG TPA: NADPH:quinone oxidoreductase family protein [Xanthobacteraceae bacterium]|nr:NADPH:quinone oxidoreductase family protein [Xanthobacteraceae bacterium]